MYRLFAAIAAVFGGFAAFSYFVLAVDEYRVTTIHCFLALICLGLAFWTGRKKFRSTPHARHPARGPLVHSLLCILLAALLVFVNALSQKYELFWLDTTRQKKHSLAPQTVQLLENLREDVLLRTFFVGGRVEPELEQLLERMRSVSTRLSWKRIDPEQNQQIAHACHVSRAGSVHVELAPSANQPCSGRGVVLEKKLDEEALVNALAALVTPKRFGRILFIAGHGEPSPNDFGRTGYGRFAEALKAEGYRVDELILGNRERLPDDTGLLVISALQKPWLEEETKLLKDYLQQQGRVLFLFEQGKMHQIAEILAEREIVVGNDIIIDRDEMPFGGEEFAVEPIIRDYGKHPIVKDFHQPIRLTTASSIKSNGPNHSRSITPLAFSASTSWAESNRPQLFSELPSAPKNPSDMIGPVPVALAYEDTTNHQSPRFVVVSDAEFGNNANIGQYFNRDFLVNSINWLAGVGGQITIRPASLQAEKNFLLRDQFSALFIISGILYPELILLVGCLLWWKRRS